MVGLVNVVGLLSGRLINESIAVEWAQEQGVVPTGLVHFAPLHPALPCRAFTCRRYAAESGLIVFHMLCQRAVLRLSHEVVLRQSLKAVAYPKSMDETASRDWAIA